MDKIAIKMDDGGRWHIIYPNGREVTIIPPQYGGYQTAYYPSREEIKEYYTGPVLINPNSLFSNGSPVFPFPNPFPYPYPGLVPAPV